MTSYVQTKMEPGSLCIVYLFQYQLTFKSGLGNKENKAVSTFKRRPLLHLEQVFSDNVLPDPSCYMYDEMHKIQVYAVT